MIINMLSFIIGIYLLITFFGDEQNVLIVKERMPRTGLDARLDPM